MDLFGEALYAYYKGDRSKFYLRDNSGKLYEHDLSRYFRNSFLKSEMRLISLTYGDILDVGCATGNYLPLLEKHGAVTGIDISEKAIEVARKIGCKNCLVRDIFSFSGKKFDTITLLENNLGLGGSVEGTKGFLNKLSALMRDGQILGLLRNIPDRDYLVVELRPLWKKRIGKKFKWIHLNVEFLAGLCREEGLRLDSLWGNQHLYLVRIVHI